MPAELQIYDEGGHGFGVRKTGRPVSNWSEQCALWLKHRGILPSGVRGNELARHDRPTRKVIVGTSMTRWYSDYPGLSGRLEQMRRLIDQMVAESRAKYGRSIDLALFTEYAITAGKSGTAAEIAVPVNDTIVQALASKAREYKTYIVFGGVFLDDPAKLACSNAAVVIDRKGRLAGRYDKAHPVLDRIGPEGQIVLEGGVRPGTAYNVLDLDFGRVNWCSIQLRP